MSALLEVSDLTVRYGAVLGLHDVTLAVPAETPVSILGPNGAGKSTLLRAVSGLLRFHGGRVAAGQVRYDGTVVTGWDAARLVRAGVAQVLEGRHVFGDLTVDENLRAGSFAGRRAARERTKVLDLFPVLAQRLRQPAGLLSGGEQQMLAIGRALMCSPRLLILDEPSLGLAPLIIAGIGEALRAVRAEGVAVLLVEQSSALATGVTEFSYLIESGEVRLSGSTAAVLSDDAVRATYLGVRPS